ncbi:hypothetical protein H9Y04_33685 [Streptomyces sp. TRM66268-LWL]|uniref:Integral membrane protein n=1 Tax=Streptomyces polyasparticus TaxID=2767826 RepID=A0ABR7ST34_9ACTN|nr:hypothetical protein [Streptomyces polyasparticus]MBC9717493.1 hypothetical protein [Streptomyces polyasparticus]
MEYFSGPSMSSAVAAVIVVLRYRKRYAGSPLLAGSGWAGWGAAVAAFAVGTVWAWTQGPSLINAVVLGLSLALLAGSAAEFIARRCRAQGGR